MNEHGLYFRLEFFQTAGHRTKPVRTAGRDRNTLKRQMGGVFLTQSLKIIR